MPITLEIDPGTLVATVSISERPDQTVEGKAIWELEEQVLLDHPDLSSNLRGGNFQYLGAVERGGSGKKPGTRTLLYTRPEVDPAAITPIEVAALGPDGAGLPDGVSGTPVDETPHADPPFTLADHQRRVDADIQAVAEQVQRERSERNSAAIADHPRDPGRDITMLTDEDKEKLAEQARRDPTIQPGPPHTSPLSGTGGVQRPDRVDPQTGEPLPPDAPSLPPEEDETTPDDAEAETVDDDDDATTSAPTRRATAQKK
jgi:hypothetical protein